MLVVGGTWRRENWKRAESQIMASGKSIEQTGLEVGGLRILIDAS